MVAIPTLRADEANSIFFEIHYHLITFAEVVVNYPLVMGILPKQMSLYLLKVVRPKCMF